MAPFQDEMTAAPIAPREKLRVFRAKDPYIKLEGQGSIRVWTEIRVPEAAPGALLAGLVYHAHAVSDAERRNDDLVVGLYRADPVNLTIVPAPAR